MLYYKGVEMTEVKLNQSTSATKEDTVFIIPTSDKPVKIVYEDPPCPVFDNIRCEYSEIIKKEMEIGFKCINFENCPVINNE